MGKAGTSAQGIVKGAARPGPVPSTETSEKILDLAETLIQTRGFSAFSYQDIANVLGIRKSSIHYHFESKADLGIAVINRYIDQFDKKLEEIELDETASSMSMLEHYTTPYTIFAETPDRVCLSGALAGEILALPPELRDRVSLFFRSHQQWLKRILERGVARGEFKLLQPAEKMARLIFGTLQGALLIKRTTGDVSQMQDVIEVLKARLV